MMKAWLLDSSSHAFIFLASASVKKMTMTSGVKMKIIITLILLLSCPVLLGSQTKSDFSGRWIFDASRSDVSTSGLRSTSFEITHRDPELKLLERTDLNGVELTQQSVYYSDGRGEANTRKGQRIESVTKWDGKRLVIKYAIPIRVIEDDGEVRNDKIKVTEKWELSKDGQTLKRRMTRSVPADLRVVPWDFGDSEEIELVYWLLQ